MYLLFPLATVQLKITARRVLKYFQLKLRHCGDEMIKDIRHYAFVDLPFLAIAEGVNFDGKAFFCWFQLTDQKCHFIIVNICVISKISLNIFPERADIGKMPSINDLGCVNIIVLIMFGNLHLLAVDIISKQFNFFESV